ncbi:DsbA family protein [Microbacterium rhizophilus]|uniref:DsbA family protein n=1 Tax=Microbacterium rhizophilus TaxID=3138934 RepID=UPI0031F14C6B
MMAGSNGRTNWVAIWISAAVVVVLVVIGVLVVWMNNQATSGGDAPQAGNIDAETGAISIGDGDDVLSEYLDFMCPVCNQFHQVYGDTIRGLIDDGSITFDIHPIAILDAKSQGTEYSTRAANAMYCVAEESEDAVLPFYDLLFENQPQETTPGLTDEQLIEFAGQAGAEGAADCITDGTHSRFVSMITEKTPVPEGAGGIGTPTVLLNGEFLQLTGDPEADLVGRLAG